MFRAKSGGSFASKIAHTSTLPALGNKDLKLLQGLITSEKTVLTTMQKLATDISRSSDSLKAWGQGEGDDLGDILSSMATMYAHISSALNNFANHHHGVRAHLKDIRTREETLDEMKRRRKNVAGKADAADKKLSRMSGENKNLPSQTELLNKLRDEIRQLDTDIMVEDAKLGDFKRISTRNLMALKLGGLLEFGEKATIIGELGKLMIEEIPVEPTPPGQPRAFFQGQTQVSNLVAEASKCIDGVAFSVPPEATLSSDAYAPPVSAPPVSGPPISTSGGAGLLPPIGELGHTSEDGGTDMPSELRVVNNFSYASPSSPYATNMNTGPISGLPPSEFGESTDTASRRFATGPNTTSTGPKLGGHFNTFPVKARSDSNATAGGLSLGGDFGSSMAGALGGVGENPNANNDIPSVTVGGSPWDRSAATSPTSSAFNQSHIRAQSQESTYLPYNSPYEPAPVVPAERQDSIAGSTLSAERGVRFRTPSMEVTGMQPIAPGVASPVNPHGGSGWRTGDVYDTGMRDQTSRPHGRASNDVPPSPLSPPPDYSLESQSGQDQFSPTLQEYDYYNPYDEHGRTPVSPYPQDRLVVEAEGTQRGGEADHAKLNAAAAREIQRELDAAIQDQPLSSPQLAYQPQQLSTQSAPGTGPIRPLDIHGRSPSPLAPPQAPFAQGRSTSPSSPSGGGGYTSPTNIDGRTQPPWAGNYSYGRTSPLPAPNANVPETYSTPPEYPSSPSPLIPQQVQTGSTTSLTSVPAPTGGRTITAAAFKRRGALPSSPYPASKQSQGAPAPIQMPPSGAGRGQGAGSPVYSDYGSIGGTRITNAHPGDE